MSTKAQINAWNDITSNHAKNLEEAITLVMDGQIETGVTKDELINTLKIRHQTITSRLSLLQDKGKIYHKDQERGGCTIFYLAAPALWNVHASKRQFRKFQEHLNRGVKEFGMDAENVGPLLNDYIEKNKLPTEFIDVSDPTQTIFIGAKLYDSFTRVQMSAKRRIFTATFKLSALDLQIIKDQEEIIIRGRRYLVPDILKSEDLSPGIHQLTMDEINPKFD